MNELNLRMPPSSTGLTIVARLRNPGGSQQGTDISCPENGSVAGFYSGAVPGGTPAGVYTIDFVDTGTGRVIVGELHWSGTEELTIDDAVEDIATLSGAMVGFVQSGLTAQGYTASRATKLDNLDAAITAVLSAIAALNNVSTSQVQTAAQAALTAQGYTTTRAPKLDFLDTSVAGVSTAILAAIAGLDDLSSAQVQAAVLAALNTQGYSSARALKLDNLDAAISSVIGAISGLNNLSITGVQTALTNQGYTGARATLLDNLATILTSVERVRKISGNKVVVSLNELTVTVYEDNGTTPAFTFAISSDKLTRTPS